NETTRKIYLNRQNQLMVASYNKNATDNNGGILRFYSISDAGNKVELFKDTDEKEAERIWEFKGFGRIVDIKYKESK
ncbi:hypothetical protein EVA_09871, partial [gut metagenome]